MLVTLVVVACLVSIWRMHFSIWLFSNVCAQLARLICLSEIKNETQETRCVPIERWSFCKWICFAFRFIKNRRSARGNWRLQSSIVLWIFIGVHAKYYVIKTISTQMNEKIAPTKRSIDRYNIKIKYLTAYCAKVYICHCGEKQALVRFRRFQPM